MKNLFRTLVCSLVAALPLLSQSPRNAPAAIDYSQNYRTRVATAVRIHEPIRVDGRLDDPAWKLAVPATGFIQWGPRNGTPSSEPTEVFFLYDDDNLYVGFNCLDSDAAHMSANDLKEDYTPSDTDGVTLVIDSLGDRRSGFMFSTNPSGARRDAQFTYNGNINGLLNNDWDGVWDVKVSRNEGGWIAEFIVPFKTLRFSSSSVQEWSIQMTRRVLRLNEETDWAPLPVRYRPSGIGLAGTLKGIENIRQGLNLRVKPFVTAAITDNSADTDRDIDGGVDAKYSLTPSLTLDATYRTDFAQVEVDQQQVNLTRFNLFFPEKRDFFLENAGVFGFGGAGGNNSGGNFAPFYSRRIGLSAAGTLIPIIGGARVSGAAGPYTLGFLAMKTDNVKESAGRPAIPANNYYVGRIMRSILRGSHVGALVTSRDSTVNGDFNRVYGADTHLQFFGRLELDSYLLRSETTGRPRSGDQARKFAVAWRDDELAVSGEYNTIQPNFNPEVGFVRRGNVSQYSGDFSWLPRFRNNDTLRNLRFSTSADYYGGAGSGKVETRTQSATTGIQFQNNGSTNFTVNHTFDRLLSPFRIRNGVSIPSGDYSYYDYVADFTSDPGATVSGNINANWGDFWNGRRRSFGGGAGWKPNAHVRLDLSYSRNRVELPAGQFSTQLSGIRFGYAFNSRAFLNAFFQYNTDTHQLSSNIRFNITHHPLSDVYVVYNDTRDTFNRQLVGRSLTLKLTNLFTF